MDWIHENPPRWDDRKQDIVGKADAGIFELGVPILGICYGLQLLVHQLGGLVERAPDCEYGRAVLKQERDRDEHQSEVEDVSRFHEASLRSFGRRRG